MNMHALVAGKIARINPLQPVSVQLSQSSMTATDGSRIPAFSQPIGVMGQVQDLQQRDLRQLEQMNVQGSQRTVYLNGEVDAIVRFSQKGGDLLTLMDESIWLTTAILEQWPDWVKCSITQQIA